MNRLERLQKREKSAFSSMQSLVGLFGIALLSEVLVKIPRRLSHTEPSLLHDAGDAGKNAPVFDKNTNTLEIKTGTRVALNIDGVNFDVYDIRKRGSNEASAKIRLGGKFIKREGNTPTMLGGFSEEISSNNSVIINGVEFTHKT